jgi:hypothetical protein
MAYKVCVLEVFVGSLTASRSPAARARQHTPEREGRAHARPGAVRCNGRLDRYLIRLDSLMVKPSEPLALTSSSNSFAMFVLRVVWN